VRRAFVEVRGKGLVAGSPKSRAGLRRVGLPRAVVAELRKHLAEYVGAEPWSLVFTGPKGAPIRRGNARKLLRWNDALTAVGLTGVRFHDLRHIGNTLAARSGVSTRDLMTRMGHDSVRAAIIYQHATTEADARIAGSLDADIARAIAGGQVDGVCGPRTHRSAVAGRSADGRTLADQGDHGGAGEGNRTLMASLEGWSSTIELHPRAGSAWHTPAVRLSGRGDLNPRPPAPKAGALPLRHSPEGPSLPGPDRPNLDRRWPLSGRTMRS
jgi:Phage integrase family